MSNQGKVWWNELGTRDVAGSKTFYGKILGWKFEEMDVGMGPYNVAMHGEGPAGGIFNMQGEQFDGVPQHWMVYFAVDDVDATCAQVKANAGSVHQEPFDVPQVGRIAMCADPSGGMFGIMTPAEDAPSQG